MWISLRDNKVVFEFVLGKVDEDIISLLSSLEIAGRSEATEEAIYSLSQRIKKEWYCRKMNIQ